MGDFTADTGIEAALQRGPEVAAVFGKLGLRCAVRPEWCAAVGVETLRHASLFHGVELETILKALNALTLPPPPAA